MTAPDVTACVTCDCGAVYTVTWQDDNAVSGLPCYECDCGVTSEQLEQQARLHLADEAEQQRPREEQPYRDEHGPRETAEQLHRIQHDLKR